MRFIAYSLVVLNVAYAATYFVDKTNNTSSDANPGTIELPFLTISRASKAASSPGDIVYVRSGTYEERITCNHSGTAAGGFITFAGYSGDPKPLTRGFILSDKRYIRIIGFEISHNNPAFNHGITFSGACDHCEILDNYIHDIQGHAVRWYDHDCSYITVRGNELYMAGCPSGVPGECTGNGWAVQMAKGHHNLVEYNHAHRVGDFINVHTGYTIVRNNYLHDFRDTYWPDGNGSGLHCDMFQPCGSSISESVYQIYESNFLGENVEVNSHILQMRRTQGDTDHHIVFRGNVGYDFGSYAMQCGGIDHVSFYNNTIHDVNKCNPQNFATRYNNEGENHSLYNHNFNNVFSTTGTGAPISVESGCSCAASDNLCYKTGNHESCESTGDPSFVNGDARDFHLRAGSPAINLGKAITTVTGASGTGSTFDVANADFFCDGYGISGGDIIKVGSNAAVSIIAINGNTVTVNREIRWTSGDGVYWRNQDSLPDAGAYEYRPEGYDFSIALSNPVDGQSVNGPVAVAMSAKNVDCIRFVIFYIDGIPVAKDTESPYSYTWDASAPAAGTKHVVECRAFALYASKNSFRSDTATVTVASTALDKTHDASKGIFSICQKSSPGICVIRCNAPRGAHPFEKTLKMYAISGILLDELRSASDEFRWDVQTIAKGIYYIELTVSPKKRIHRAIVIQ